jgi:hypothetical protein
MSLVKRVVENGGLSTVSPRRVPGRFNVCIDKCDAFLSRGNCVILWRQCAAALLGDIEGRVSVSEGMPYLGRNCYY